MYHISLVAITFSYHSMKINPVYNEKTLYNHCLFTFAIFMKYFLKENNFQRSGWLCNKIYIMNTNFCSVTLYYLRYNDTKMYMVIA